MFIVEVFINEKFVIRFEKIWKWYNKKTEIVNEEKRNSMRLCARVTKTFAEKQYNRSKQTDDASASIS